MVKEETFVYESQDAIHIITTIIIIIVSQQQVFNIPY